MTSINTKMQSLGWVGEAKRTASSHAVNNNDLISHMYNIALADGTNQ